MLSVRVGPLPNSSVGAELAWMLPGLLLYLLLLLLALRYHEKLHTVVSTHLLYVGSNCCKAQGLDESVEERLNLNINILMYVHIYINVYVYIYTVYIIIFFAPALFCSVIGVQVVVYWWSTKGLAGSFRHCKSLPSFFMNNEIWLRMPSGVK